MVLEDLCTKETIIVRTPGLTRTCSISNSFIELVRISYWRGKEKKKNLNNYKYKEYQEIIKSKGEGRPYILKKIVGLPLAKQ